MSFITTILGAFMFGLVCFAAIPLIGAIILPWEDDVEGSRLNYTANDLADAYIHMGTACLGRMLLLQRSHGGLKFKKTTYDARNNTEKIRLNGEWKHWVDPRHYMSQLKNRPFGLAHEDSNVILNTRITFCGRRYRQLHDTGEWTKEAAGKTYRKAYFALEEGSRHLVNLKDALPVVQGSADPGSAELQETYTEKGQSMYDRRRLLQHTGFFMALGIGFGLMLLAARVGQSAGSTGVTIGI